MHENTNAPTFWWLLRIFVGQLKKESVTADEIQASLEDWINNRELTTRDGDK